MDSIGSQSQMLLNRLDSVWCQLRDSNTCDGVGMHEHVILLAGMILQFPSVDGCQCLERAGNCCWLLMLLLWVGFQGQRLPASSLVFPGEAIYPAPDSAQDY